MNNHNILAFAHIGDLHITKAKEQNYIDFLSIVSQIETECGGMLDFVFLPGDNADQGTSEQYKLVSTALKMFSLPIHIIAGDHDMEQGNLTGFYAMSATDPLPKSLSIKGMRCIFLDINGTGKGGPDFRLGEKQLSWLETELKMATEKFEKTLIFMHAYPDDLRDGNEAVELNGLVSQYQVVLVDMGHTHYNELANDGATIFAATRSTGQIEEGPVGYSIITVDDGVVGWRFKPLQGAFPFVAITSPADYRLLRTTDGRSETGSLEVRAMVFGYKKIDRVVCQIDNETLQPMTCSEDGRTWSAILPGVDVQPTTLTVEAFDESGRPGRHTIEPASPLHKKTDRTRNGSDADSIGAWPQNGILGTQLGPNRNGKPS